MTVSQSHALDGKFVQVDRAVSYVRHNRLRYVRDTETIISHGVAADIVPVTSEDLRGLKRGAMIPLRYTKDQWVEGRADNYERMRELAVSVARGKGIELGAGPRPCAVPLDCDVTYVDAYEAQDQVDRMFGGTKIADMMPVDVKDSFDKLSTFSKASLDFIIGSHVIEHLIDPIGAIAKSYDRLRDGGWLFLIVPDKRYTFDVNRETTTFEHLFQDFKSPNRSRDYEHYVDYYTTSAKTADPRGDARKAFEAGEDVHFHTWTCLTFYEMIDQIRSLGIAPWRNVWWQPKISSDSYAMEFYFALKK